MKIFSKILLVAAIAVVALACQNAGDTSVASQSSAASDSTALVQKLAPNDTVSAQGYQPTGDIARDAVTYVQVLYDRNTPFELKDSVGISFTAYYVRQGKGDEWEKAVDAESRKLTGEEQVKK